MPQARGWEIGDLVFEETIKENKDKSIFRVSHQEQHYILKVFHPIPRTMVRFSYKESDLFKREYHAYTSMTAAGLCDKGVIPRFIGTLQSINPFEVAPFLDRFLDDIDPVNGVLLEYIPGLSMYGIDNFTPQRNMRFHQALLDIHRCGVVHCDTWPRQMMVQHSSDRILWLDFDCAQTFPPNHIPDRWQAWMKEEEELVEYFLNALVSDAKEGKISLTWDYYYSYE